jgi:hypothetical protein
MITFAELRAAAPDIAGPIADRFERSFLGMLGTVRRDGSPRVSPIEVGFHDDRLYVGMTPTSAKRRDVERDPRISLVTALADKDDLAGEGKLFGVVALVTDVVRVAAVQGAHAEATGFDPDTIAGSPLFEVLVGGAAWQLVDGDAFVTRSWSASGGRRHRRRVGVLGAVEDVPPAS